MCAAALALALDTCCTLCFSSKIQKTLTIKFILLMELNILKQSNLEFKHIVQHVDERCSTRASVDAIIRVLSR